METTTVAMEVRGLGVFQPSRARLEQLSAWFDAEYPTLLRFAYFVSGGRSTAEDLVQEAFVRIYRAGGRVGEPGFGTYARRTIVNLHRSSFRRRSREDEAFARTGVSGVAAGPDVGARDEVWQAVLGLSPRQRAIVALRYYEELSEKEVADALGMSPGAVKKHTSRAMDRLRGVLGRES